MTPSRTSYREHLGFSPDSIPGKACDRGDYDHAPGFTNHLARLEEAKNRAEGEHG